MNLITPLALLATLASGFVTITVLTAGPRARTFKHTRAVIAALLFYNLLVILGLTWELVRPELPKAVPGRFGLSLLAAILLVLGYLKIAWLYSLVVLSGKILDRPVSGRIKPVFLGLAGLLTLLGAAAGTPLFGSRPAGVFLNALSWWEYPFIAASMAVGVHLFVGAKRLAPGRVRNAAIFLGLIFFLFFSVTLTGLILGQDQAPGKIGIARLANALGLLLFNLAVFFWVRAFAASFPADAGAEFYAPADLPARYGLTAREIEIIALVCRGRTNKDIADELCISPQTVKDHNYNIFRKTGVKNRTQLARLFMR